MTSQNFVI